MFSVWGGGGQGDNCICREGRVGGFFVNLQCQLTKLVNYSQLICKVDTIHVIQIKKEIKRKETLC